MLYRYTYDLLGALHTCQVIALSLGYSSEIERTIRLLWLSAYTWLSWSTFVSVYKMNASNNNVLRFEYNKSYVRTAFAPSAWACYFIPFCSIPPMRQKEKNILKVYKSFQCWAMFLAVIIIIGSSWFSIELAYTYKTVFINKEVMAFPMLLENQINMSVYLHKQLTHIHVFSSKKAAQML